MVTTLVGSHLTTAGPPDPHNLSTRPPTSSGETRQSRDTIRKAQHELDSGITCADNFSARGRKPVEFHLPHLLPDLCDLVRDQLQTDPTFQTTGLYCRLSASEVRKQLIERKGYTDERLPSVQTIGDKLNLLGFRLRTVIKSRPQKK